MDEIQKVLIKAGRKDLAQKYYSAVKPEQIYKKDWPEIWSYLTDAFNFVKDGRANRSTPSLLMIKGTRQLVFKEAIKRIDADMPTEKDWADTDRMFPKFRKEYEKAKRMI